MTDQALPVVPAHAGTHTAEFLGSFKMSDNLRCNDVLWLWVPAFAGTTVKP